MLVEIRIYRRHDADLIMLKSYGVNISKMMRLALENYVRGERIKFRLPDSHSCDITDCSMLRYRLNVKNPDVIRLLKNIKRGYRNQFCKALLRDMLDAETLGVYLATDEAIAFEDDRLEHDSMVAGDELGLISKRDQITSETFFVARQGADEDDVKSTVKKVEKEAARARKEDEKYVDGLFSEKISAVQKGDSPIYQRRNAGKKKDRFSWDEEDSKNSVTNKTQNKKKEVSSDTDDSLPFLNAESFAEMTRETDDKPQINAQFSDDDNDFDGFGEGFSGMFDDEEPSEEVKKRKEEERNQALSSMFNNLLSDTE